MALSYDNGIEGLQYQTMSQNISERIKGAAKGWADGVYDVRTFPSNINTFHVSFLKSLWSFFLSIIVLSVFHRNKLVFNDNER